MITSDAILFFLTLYFVAAVPFTFIGMAAMINFWNKHHMFYPKIEDK